VTHVRLPSGRVFDTDQVARCERSKDYMRDPDAPIRRYVAQDPLLGPDGKPIFFDVVRVWWKGVVSESPADGEERFVDKDASAIIVWMDSVPEIGK